jgi:hypothetical protein
MPQSLTNLPTTQNPSAFHRELKNNYWKCHNHRRPCRRNMSAFHRELKNNYWKCHNHRQTFRRPELRRHFTESWKIITGNATITDECSDGFQSIGMLSAGQYYRPNHRRTVWIPKGSALNASLTASFCQRNYRRTAKNIEGN